MLPYATAVSNRYAPFVTWSLIAVNVFVFLYQLGLPKPELELFLRNYGLVPSLFFQPQWTPELGLQGGSFVPVVTNIFLHGSLLHLLFNMWTLFIFGPAIEDRLGGMRFFVYYMLCGIGASLAHAYVNATSTIPVLGASGAIAGIMGAYLRLFPLARMLVIIPIFFIPLFFEVYAAVFIGIWFLMQLIGGLTDLFTGVSAVNGGIAWWAHIGGFVAGWILIDFVRLKPNAYRPYYRDEGIHGFLPDGRREGKGPWL